MFVIEPKVYLLYISILKDLLKLKFKKEDTLLDYISYKENARFSGGLNYLKKILLKHQITRRRNQYKLID